MNKKLEKNIFKKYPSLFPVKKYRNSRLNWGLECGDGWYKIIDKFCDKVSKRANKGIEIIELREKWAEILINVHYDSEFIPKIDDLIKELIDKSCKTCEWCGKTKNIFNKSLVLENTIIFKTLCNSCYKSFVKKMDNYSDMKSLNNSIDLSLNLYCKKDNV